MKVYIKTYGCQMNERDSNALGAALLQRGYELTDNEKEADILLFNTCSVREQAELKAIGKVGILKKLKKVRPHILIGMLGCMAQSKGNTLLEKLPHLDFVIGTDQLQKLPDIIEMELAKREQLSFTETNTDISQSMAQHLETNSVSDFIAIMRGCDMFCSYCIVPYVRGREKSREIAEIADEAKKLADKGIKEIMLLGQNVSAFGLEQNSKTRPSESPFADLLREINSIKGIERVRFISPHPFFFNDKLINTIAECEKVCNNIHLPLQSGSNRILKLMNRRYDSAMYMEIVKKLKKIVPDITFSTDVIVAFPGETDEDFNCTRNIMNEVGFDNAYIFKYSPREGTPAAKYQDQIPQHIKEERNQILLADLKERTTEHNKLMEDRIFKILVEGPSQRNPERWCGRTTNNKVTVFDYNQSLKTGDIIEVHIDRSSSMTLFGSILNH
ncbi:MAG TPA: tRNA (N6-isopentenyl adenosine(37)-C2)-methylthiotransferase MiaB [Lentisphaeria bacterium]|nr:MAG: tRNA (N6-isopentenyl adenosine(37)-C2)-methylthiotransferase MiaB [Lentisphaerae bacterium GWF2_38_69]HBM15406.1 tRNA (N6-isopentenyl adenosine(37)-C2)-methylthiotransferase MiaB [Lentisphaeria bacterium]